MDGNHHEFDFYTTELEVDMKNLKITSIVFLTLLMLIETHGVLGQTPTPNPDWIRAISWKPDGSQIAYGTEHGTVQIDDFNGNFVKRWSNDGSIYDLKWSPDGEILATGDSNGHVTAWNANSGAKINQIQVYANVAVNFIAWSPDSTKLAAVSFSFGSIPIWTITKDKPDRLLIPGDTVAATWSPDGTKLAVGRLKKLEIWDPISGQLLKTIDTPQYVLAIKWLPDAKQLVTADALTGQDSRIRIWDVAAGTLLKEFGEPGSQIWSIELNPEGTKVVSSSFDGMIRIWDIQSGKTLAVYQTTERTFSAAWSPFGGRIVYATGPLAQVADFSSQANLPDPIIKLVAPPTSKSDLKLLITRCPIETTLQKQLIADVDKMTSAEFTAGLRASSDQIFPPCMADVQAVANSLQNTN